MNKSNIILHEIPCKIYAIKIPLKRKYLHNGAWKTSDNNLKFLVNAS